MTREVSTLHDLWVRGYVGQWRSMGALDRWRFEVALAHFAEISDSVDATVARSALREIRAEVERAACEVQPAAVQDAGPAAGLA